MDSGGAEMDFQAAQMDPGGAEVPKLGSKIHQVGVQNPSSWGPKSIKNQAWEGSGGHLDVKIDFLTILAPTWTPKPSQNGAKLGAKNLPKWIF